MFFVSGFSFTHSKWYLWTFAVLKTKSDLLKHQSCKIFLYKTLNMCGDLTSLEASGKKIWGLLKVLDMLQDQSHFFLDDMHEIRHSSF